MVAAEWKAKQIVRDYIEDEHAGQKTVAPDFSVHVVQFMKIVEVSRFVMAVSHDSSLLYEVTIRPHSKASFIEVIRRVDRHRIGDDVFKQRHPSAVLTEVD
jgi:hypothetical protein